MDPKKGIIEILKKVRLKKLVKMQNNIVSKSFFYQFFSEANKSAKTLFRWGEGEKEEKLLSGLNIYPVVI